MSYSQSDEEGVIVGAFEKVGVATGGTFLDIGAYDGKAFSNTMRLVELGWGGVCVEPSPTVFPALLNRHCENPNIQIVNAAISPGEPSMLEFYDSGGDAISTTNLAHVQKWTMHGNAKYKKFYVYTLPLHKLFESFGYAFDFINIDVESTNWPLFCGLPFEQLVKTRMICVEHDYKAEEMTALAARYGFQKIHQNGENLILFR